MPQKLGTKRASKIQKLFNLSKEGETHQNDNQKALKPRREEAQDQTTQDSVSCYSLCPATQTLAYCSEESMHQEK